MRIKLSFIILLLVSLSTSSCYEFWREKDQLDAQSDGKAKLMQAEFEKKTLIEDAKAQNEAATLNAEAKIKIAKAQAQAEIERAKGVAEANRIIGESLKGNDSYLRYLWITGINDGEGERIYIPTEAGLPILEARRNE